MLQCQTDFNVTKNNILLGYIYNDLAVTDLHGRFYELDFESAYLIEVFRIAQPRRFFSNTTLSTFSMCL